MRHPRFQPRGVVRGAPERYWERGRVQHPPAPGRGRSRHPPISRRGRAWQPPAPRRGRSRHPPASRKGKPGCPPVSRRGRARRPPAPGRERSRHPSASRRGGAGWPPVSGRGRAWRGRVRQPPAPGRGRSRHPTASRRGRVRWPPASGQRKALQCPHPSWGAALRPVALPRRGPQMPPGWGAAGAGHTWPSTEPRASVTRGPLSCLLGQPSSGPATSTALRSDPEWHQGSRPHWGPGTAAPAPQAWPEPTDAGRLLPWTLTLRAVKGRFQCCFQVTPRPLSLRTC